MLYYDIRQNADGITLGLNYIYTCIFLGAGHFGHKTRHFGSRHNKIGAEI